MVYENCKFYGPYLNKKDNRLRCILVNIDTKVKKTISYPKYLMEVYLNRYLLSDETVDHIDGNPLNNEISNLRIINRKEHCSNDVLRNKDTEVICKMCGKHFIIKGSNISSRNRKDKSQSGYFCSKQCSGRYGALIGRNKLKQSKVERIIPEKYKLHKY